MIQQAFASPEEALAHYGKKGMKWGVRNEDEPVGRDSAGRIAPTADKPVGRDEASRLSPGAPESTSKPGLSERKQRSVDKFLKRSDVMNTQISELKLENEKLGESRKHAYTRHVNRQSIQQLEKTQQRALKDAEAVKKGKLTSTQKKVIVGAVAVSALAAYVAVNQGQQSGALNSYKLLAQARLRGQSTPFQVNKGLSGKMSVADLLSKVAKPVNPGYSSPGGQMNCRRSTFAYELRRRGFDVHATTSAVGWGQSESGVINAVTPGSRNFYRNLSLSETIRDKGSSAVARGDKRVNPVKKILLDNLGVNPQEEAARVVAAVKAGKSPSDLFSMTSSSSKRVLEELAKQPNGARGEVVFKFPQFGHSMAYEVVDGTPHIFDSQKGTLYNAATKMVESKWDGFHSAEITRLDNVDLDVNFLTRWATNVGGKK